VEGFVPAAIVIPVANGSIVREQSSADRMQEVDPKPQLTAVPAAAATPSVTLERSALT